VGETKRLVYVLQSEKYPTRYYAGITSDIRNRLAVHNAGGSQHTRASRPWRVIVSLDFATESSAVAFEKYLKTGSGARLPNATLSKRSTINSTT